MEQTKCAIASRLPNHQANRHCRGNSHGSTFCHSQMWSHLQPVQVLGTVESCPRQSVKNRPVQSVRAPKLSWHAFVILWYFVDMVSSLCFGFFEIKQHTKQLINPQPEKFPAAERPRFLNPRWRNRTLDPPGWLLRPSPHHSVCVTAFQLCNQMQSEKNSTTIAVWMTTTKPWPPAVNACRTNLCLTKTI
jgi:hypothetical protein